MWVRALVASSHYLALALGFWSVMERGHSLRSLTGSKNPEIELSRVFFYDNFWGLSALLWVATGVLRAFGGLEKGSDYYLANPLFWTKLCLFAGILLLELTPMVTFIRLRIAVRKKTSISLSEGRLKLLWTLNALEVLFVVLIVFVAGLMARGAGL